MKKPLRIILYIFMALMALSMISALVWGQTLKMAKANRLLTASQPEQARTIYEQMAAHSPESPHLLHNLGLVFYAKNQYEKAVANFSNAQKKVVAPEFRSNQSIQNDLSNRIDYNLGNALFKQAEKSSGEQSNHSYQSALENYKKAIISNRGDLDAKYNYELTRIRLKQMQNNQSSPPKNQPDNQGQKKSQPNQSNSSKSGSEKQQPAHGQSKEQNSPSQPGKGQMTKEEAEALLKMMKTQDQSKAPIMEIHDSQPKQDW
jgi:tetratricopeptide (TPR) repeat protein